MFYNIKNKLIKMLKESSMRRVKKEDNSPYMADSAKYGG